DALGDMAVRQIRKCPVSVEDRNGLTQRFHTIDDVTMAEQSALWSSRCARSVNHDGYVVGVCLSGPLAQKRVVALTIVTAALNELAIGKDFSGTASPALIQLNYDSYFGKG